MAKIEFIYFDAANTLIHKPLLWEKYAEVLEKYGHKVDSRSLKKHHKLISEKHRFPDVTSREFYSSFNKEVLMALGIHPDTNLVDDIFAACSYLPWQAFEDVKELKSIRIPMGVISNFNSSLKQKITALIDLPFEEFLVSEDLGIAKPDQTIYRHALARLGIEAASVLYIGDSIALDIEPALNLGMTACLIDRDSVYPAYPNRITGLDQLKQLIS